MQIPSDDWRLAESVAERVFSFYSDAFGSLGPLYSQAGITSPGQAGWQVLPLDDLARLTSHAVNALARRDLMLIGRQGLRPGDWRVVMYSLTSAQTLRDAITRGVECFEAIDWRCGRMNLHTHGDKAQLEVEAMRSVGSEPVGCLIDLFGLLEIHGLLGWLIDRDIPLGRVSLKHPAATFEALQLPAVPFPVRLESDWTGFDFSTALLDHPVVRSWEQRERRPPRNLLFALTEEISDRGAMEARVRKITMSGLKQRSRLPLFEEVVAAINTSEATLRRQLAREGTSFRNIRESCRRELALHFLRRTELSIEEVATRLDFCDSDAFRNAFKSWTGQSPTAYRLSNTTAPERKRRADWY